VLTGDDAATSVPTATAPVAGGVEAGAGIDGLASGEVGAPRAGVSRVGVEDRAGAIHGATKPEVR